MKIFESQGVVVMVILALLFLAFVIFINYYINPMAQESIDKNKEFGKVCFQDHCFNVELAISLKERQAGLMFREFLDQDEGMLFVFEPEGNYPFWMKNTLVQLDIIWINERNEVVFINKNTQPCYIENCPSINPGVQAKYVLEINSGKVDQIGLALGSKVSIEY